MINRYIFSAIAPFLFILLILPSLGNAQHVSQPLKIYFEKCLKKESTTEYQAELLKGDVAKFINELESLTSDSSLDKRHATYRLLAYLGQKTENVTLRQRSVKKLIAGSNDKDGGIAGNCLKMLCSFLINDFDTESKYQLSEMAKKTHSHYEKVIKLCGWLRIKDLSYDFQKIIEEKKAGVRDRWAMRLAMARMGDTDMVNYCLARLQKVGVDNDVVYDFFPDIVYTHQKPLFDYLLTVIESDQKQCSSSNPDSDTKIICAYRVIEQLAPCIKDFPAKTDPSGSLISNNYEQTLNEVRAWIQQNRSTYTIVEDKF